MRRMLFRWVNQDCFIPAIINCMNLTLQFLYRPSHLTSILIYREMFFHDIGKYLTSGLKELSSVKRWRDSDFPLLWACEEEWEWWDSFHPTCGSSSWGSQEHSEVRNLTLRILFSMCLYLLIGYNNLFLCLSFGTRWLRNLSFVEIPFNETKWWKKDNIKFSWTLLKWSRNIHGCIFERQKAICETDLACACDIEAAVSYSESGDCSV